MNKIILGVLLMLLIFGIGCTSSGEAKKVSLLNFFSTQTNQNNELKINQNTGLVKWKKVYSEGETLKGLQGMPVKLQVDQISQSGSRTNYQATLSLKYETGELIDTETVTSLDRLEQEFTNSEGNYVLTTPLVVKRIGIKPDTGIGFVEFELNTWYENQNMINLWGTNNYENQKLKIHVDRISQTGTNQAYTATLSLYTDSGTLIDTKTVNFPTTLNEEFTDSEGNYALGSVVQITEIGIGATNGIGYVKATIN